MSIEIIRPADTCAVAGCERPVHVESRGLCNAHYQRWLRHGDPLGAGTGRGSNRLDLSGRRFGSFVATRRAPSTAAGNTRWFCRCDCGSEVVVARGNLTSGNSKSCGCQKVTKIAAARTKHGHSPHGKPTREYVSWRAMITRCTNPANHKYATYGAVGITVCDRWRDSFESFLADMGPRPAGTSLDRFPDNRGNYEPGNCRWGTPKQQSRNQHRYTSRGVVHAD